MDNLEEFQSKLTPCSTSYPNFKEVFQCSPFSSRILENILSRISSSNGTAFRLQRAMFPEEGLTRVAQMRQQLGDALSLLHLPASRELLIRVQPLLSGLTQAASVTRSPIIRINIRPVRLSAEACSKDNQTSPG
ncbi:hypothetical protein RhiXN_03938 [Rhizoctonia solani]|uniref:Uncharacterized protein n=1 Tax=Rhizoctonia solani TaxID=456999 RepID=A0A8H8NNL0_9AGAM|nr:uncharacterized protein RhiXN_03938 [Rhizoctonia solani]QRW15937.1 hypothetical protein RhiXN_03938 [Rhizoctonia solani]